MDLALNALENHATQTVPRIYESFFAARRSAGVKERVPPHPAAAGEREVPPGDPRGPPARLPPAEP